MAQNQDSEDAIESIVMKLFSSLGYDVLNAEREGKGTFTGSLTGRQQMDEVVLTSRLYPALERLNPNLPRSVLEAAVEILVADRSLSTLANANAQVYALLKNGVKVSFKDDDQNDLTETVSLIDWNQPENNDWLAVQQFWVLGLDGLYKKRPDVVLFVNGIPLVFIELKTFHRNVGRAYKDNYWDYKDTIPHLFWYNAMVIASNGRDSRIGSITSSWEHFSDWKRISDEEEAGRVSLETMLLGVCTPARLLDLVENFILFKQSAGGLVKYFARNHQFLGVNNAIRAVQSLADNRGRLGVFWHTQGSGKSYSMVFFAQKVLRKLPGNWTFLIVTDRQELDDQIYQNFADVGAVPNVKGKQRDIQAQNGEDLKRLLQNDNRYVFTLIQKFHTRDGETYPVLSERRDIIVMTDEAHRSQYDTFAANMRAALPNAAFIGFTGTPLIAGEEKTRDVFGEYVSVYNFKQSVDDGATVPLYYENRIPQMQLTNDQLNDDMDELLDAAMLDDIQESQLEREFRQEYQIITRAPRQEEIARDIVAHYTERGFAGRSYQSKAMVVCVDKLTAVRMYELVRAHWTLAIAHLETRITNASQAEEREALEAKHQFMRETDMAVVISSAQNEIDFFRGKGLDIRPHRQRMVMEGLDEKFKKPEDPLRLVFVCAMWMTGFDAPACSTIYLDKPMRNHTLMQTIARANRVFRDKQDGLIVDYIGVFRNLEKALAIYGTGADGSASEGELPIKEKHDRVNELRSKIGEVVQFCDGLAIDLDAILSATDEFERIGLKKDAMEALLIDQETTQHFFTLVRDVNRLFKSILPDRFASEFYVTRKVLNVLAEAIIAEVPDIDISDVAAEIGELLDESVITEAYIIEASPTDESRRVDLSQIDFDALRERFEQGYKRTTTEKLRGVANQKLQKLVRQNRTRMNYQETFQQMIEAYNAGSVNVDVMFERLMAFVNELEVEEKRAIGEQLSEEELAVFDLLISSAPDLSDKERDSMKQMAQQLLHTLKHEKLVLDWRKHQQTQASVQKTIDVFLDENLPDKYDKAMYKQKCQAIYQHIYESYFGANRSVYSAT